MARIDQLFDAVRGMRASMDRLQHAQAQKVAGVGTPVQQVLGNFAQNLKRADQAYKKASDSAAKAMQAQQAAQTRRQSVYDSVVGQIPPGQRNRANVNQALGNSPAYQAAKRRAQAARSRSASAQGDAARKRQRRGQAAAKNRAAQRRAHPFKTVAANIATPFRKATRSLAARGGKIGGAAKGVGSVFAGLGKAAGAVSAGFGKIASIAGGPLGAAFGAAISSAHAIGEAFNAMKTRLNATHQSLTGFNVAIGMAQMKLKIGDVQRQMDFGKRIQKGAVAFAESENRARNAFQSADVFAHNAGSALGTLGNNAMAALGNLLDPLFRFLNWFVELFNSLSLESTWKAIVSGIETMGIPLATLQGIAEKAYNLYIDALNVPRGFALMPLLPHWQNAAKAAPPLPRQARGPIGIDPGHRPPRRI